jgi:hypothetical protein
VRRPISATTKSQISAISATYVTSALSLLFGLSTSHHVVAAQADCVHFSEPDLLTFEELVDLKRTLLLRLRSLKNSNSLSVLRLSAMKLISAVLSQSVHLRPSLAPSFALFCWNIERGIHFDPIRIALSEPEEFDHVLAEKKDPKTEPLTPNQPKTVKQQLDILSPPIFSFSTKSTMALLALTIGMQLVTQADIQKSSLQFRTSSRAIDRYLRNRLVPLLTENLGCQCTDSAFSCASHGYNRLAS